MKENYIFETKYCRFCNHNIDGYCNIVNFLCTTRDCESYLSWYKRVKNIPNSDNFACFNKNCPHARKLELLVKIGEL